MKLFLCDSVEKHLYASIALIKKICEKNQISVEYQSAFTCEGLISSPFVLESDLLIMETRLSDGDGIQAAKILRNQGYDGLIVFFTNYEDRIRECFTVSAFRFLPKNNLSYEAFEEVMLSAREEISEEKRQMIRFSNLTEVREIPLADILYFEETKTVTIVHYGVYGETFEFHSSLKKTELSIGDRGFVRCHKNYLVAIAQIQEIDGEELKDQSLMMRNGDRIPIASKYYDDVVYSMSRG